MDNMKPSEVCKKYGFKSLKELSKLSNESEQNLINWHKTKPARFYNSIYAAILRKTIDMVNGCE